MNLILKNKRSEIFNLEAYNGKAEPIQFKVQRESFSKFGQYGTVSKGDGFVSEREITIKFDAIAERDIDYDEILNTISAFFDVEDEPFYLVNIDTQKRCKVRLENLEENYNEGLAKRIGIDCRLRLVIESALWEDEDESIVTETLNNNDEITITLDNNAKPTYTVMEITNLGTGSNGPFSLSVNNETVGFQSSILINDSSFTQNKTMILDGIEGEIYTDGVYANVKIEGGNFFPLKKGINKIKYQSFTGQSVTLSIKYRQRKSW